MGHAAMKAAGADIRHAVTGVAAAPSRAARNRPHFGLGVGAHQIMEWAPRGGQGDVEELTPTPGFRMMEAHWPYDVGIDEQWSLSTPVGRTFSYRADGLISWTASNAPPEDETWMRLT